MKCLHINIEYVHVSPCFFPWLGSSLEGITASIGKLTVPAFNSLRMVNNRCCRIPWVAYLFCHRWTSRKIVGLEFEDTTRCLFHWYPWSLANNRHTSVCYYSVFAKFQRIRIYLRIKIPVNFWRGKGERLTNWTWNTSYSLFRFD